MAGRSRAHRRTPMVGKRFGRLTVVGFSGKSASGVLLWKCRCDCGGEKVVFGTNLRNGLSKSCGCLRRELVSGRSRTHGMSRSPEHDCWRAMINRCHCGQGRPSWMYYGGRGISVCERWRTSFENFLADVGFRPGANYSIDRIDNDGNYEPGNVRWAKVEVQANNRSNNRKVTHNGLTLSISQWAKRLGTSRQAIFHRIEAGWSPELAVSTPIDPATSIGRARSAAKKGLT